MKSERRHELQTNYLADHLGSAVKTGKPYAMWVFLGLTAVVLVSVGYGLYVSRISKANSLAWGDYYFQLGTGDAEAFQQIADDHPNTAASAWAMQAWADSQLLTGFEQIYSDRERAESTIEGAIDAYQGILSSTYEPELKIRAAMGLAQAYESLGKLDDATRYYQQVASAGSDGFADVARQRVAWIKAGEGKNFYDWFATVRSTPTPPPPIPGDLSKPPTAPDMTFPQKQNPLTLPEAGTTPPATGLPGSETPSSETPSSETPSSDSSANPPPAASSETPSAPATTTPATTPASDQPTENADKPAAESDKPAADSASEANAPTDIPPKPLELPKR